MKVCPSGWRLPTEEELLSLLDTYNDISALRATSWTDASYGDGLNTSGFGALPAGYYSSGGYLHFGEEAVFWSSTEGVSSSAYYLYIYSFDADSSVDKKADGRSVRCIKD